MPEKRYTLEELEALTGISRRTIRHYIGLRLVPGPRERGRHASYGEETRHRLELIARLKEVPVEPLGRPMTPKEIGSLLETVGEQGLEQIASGEMPYRLIDTEAGDPPEDRSTDAAPDSASDYLDRLGVQRSRTREQRPDGRAAPPQSELPSLLAALLEEVEGALDDAARAQDDAWERWRRAGREGLEIRVRTPKTVEQRQRLARIARELRTLPGVSAGRRRRRRDR